jgi:hypothetical protein
MQRFGWYYFFQIIAILICIFVKGEDDLDFDFINKTVKVNIYYVCIIYFFKTIIIINYLIKSGNNYILQQL